MNDPASNLNMSCPIPLKDYPTVVLGHGGGGRLTHHLINSLFRPILSNPVLDMDHDGAVVDSPRNARLAFTTDSYVVKPLFFPGGDIGSLAIYGTVNDLSMCGARPAGISLSLIIEEGFPMELLWRVIQSIGYACQSAQVQIWTGDTKVIERSTGDGLLINTAGVGFCPCDRRIAPQYIQENDVILINGDIGRHGVAIMSSREGLEFETHLDSDCAPLNDQVESLFGHNVDIHCLRDLTRGGLASSLLEIAEKSGFNLSIEDAKIPVTAPVRGACELLGLDPLYLANEGRFIAFVPERDVQMALDSLGPMAQVIGQVRKKASSGEVFIRTEYGGERILDWLSGDLLPRIC